MALEGRAESNSRSLHWAPLRSWNLFSGRVRSKLPQESSSDQLSRPLPVRNNAEGGRGCSSTSRTSGRSRTGAGEASRKGGGLSRRDYKQSVRDGNRRQGEISVAHDYVPLFSSEYTGRRQSLLDIPLHVSDVEGCDHTVRPSEPIAHHQQHHHHDHHHHHYHYHHLYRQPLRRPNRLQDQGSRMPSVSEMVSLSHSNQGNSDQRRHRHDLETSLPSSSHLALSSRNAAIEARDRLDERLRGASFLRDRHNIGRFPGGLMDDFSILFEEEGSWSDEEIWELGIQDWLSTWSHEEGGPPDLHLLSEQVHPVIAGLSEKMIKNLPKEIFVPQPRKRDEGMRDVLMEHEDCAVCLERFLAGQVLIRLPCEHRFHPDCLTPWLESHGQCPYCRSKICGDSDCDVSSRRGANANLERSNNGFLVRIGLTNRQ